MSIKLSLSVYSVSVHLITYMSVHIIVHLSVDMIVYKGLSVHMNVCQSVTVHMIVNMSVSQFPIYLPINVCIPINKNTNGKRNNKKDSIFNNTTVRHHYLGIADYYFTLKEKDFSISS